MLTLIAIVSGAIATIAMILVLDRSRAKPREDKSTLPSSAWWLGFVWPLISWMSKNIRPWMTWGHRQRLTQSIQRAGLQRWDYADFFALQLLIGIVCMSLLIISTLWVEPQALLSWRTLCLLLFSGFLTGSWPVLWMRTQRKSRLIQIAKGLPFFLDMLVLGLDAGMNLQTALQLAQSELDAGALKEEWEQTLFDMRSGLARNEALRAMSGRIELRAIRQFVQALVQGDSMGVSLTRTVAEYARQQRQSRLLHAEKLAMEAPIKMLFPLAFCIFPCTFLVLGFPVVAQLTGLTL